MRRLATVVALLLGLSAVGILGYGVFVFVWGVPSVAQRPTPTDPETISAGKYLAAAGDCASCHTVAGGEEFAGGRPFETPFGRLYSTNITPDRATGIGGMTSAEFYQILAFGADHALSPVYPAMPYTSFHKVTRTDSDALHAYFMSLEPIAAPRKANALPFPFNIRPLMFGWNLLFAERGVFQPDRGKDDVWNRGAYLVQGLGHCGECHTPRNALGAMKAGSALAGAIIEGFEAPDLRAAALKERGWTRDDLVLFFETGASPQGSAFGEMFLAIKNSLRLLTHEDRLAIATYLMNGSADQPSKGDEAVAALGDEAHDNRAGQALYLTNCSLCHGPDGRGMAGTMPPLQGNATLAQPDGVNLIAVMAKGLDANTMSLTEGYGPMPAFGDRLSTEEMADLANYVRAAFAPNDGAGLGDLTAADVERILR